MSERHREGVAALLSMFTALLVGDVTSEEGKMNVLECSHVYQQVLS